MNWTRRRLVGTALATAGLAGCLGNDGSSGNGDGGGGDGGESDDGSGDHDAEAALEDADVTDFVGKEEIEITVDPDGNSFVPEAFEIDRRTVVNWVWEGSSVGLYPLDLPPECMWDEEDNENDEWTAGDQFDRLFWAPGAYLYASRNDDGDEFTGAFRVVETDAEADGGNESTEA